MITLDITVLALTLLLLHLLLINPIEGVPLLTRHFHGFPVRQNGLVVLLAVLGVRVGRAAGLLDLGVAVLKGVQAGADGSVFLAGIFGLEAHHALLIGVGLPVRDLLLLSVGCKLRVRHVCVCGVAQQAHIVNLGVVLCLGMAHFLKG